MRQSYCRGREATVDDAAGGQRRHPWHLLARVLGTLLVAVLLAWVLWRAWSDAAAVDWRGLRLVPGALVLSVLLPMLAFIVHGLTWVVLMRSLGYVVGWWSGMRACVMSQLGNYVPGKVVIMAIRAQVARSQGLPGIPVAGSVLLETVLRTVVGAVLVAAGLYGVGQGQHYLTGLLALIGVLVLIAHPRVFHALADWLLVKLGRDPLPRRLRLADLALLMFGYVLFWILYAAGFCCLAWGTSQAHLVAAPGLALSFILAQISSTVAVFAPVGLGVSDATLAELLRLVGAVSAAGVLALLARVWRTLCELLTVGLVWLGGRCSRCR